MVVQPDLLVKRPVGEQIKFIETEYNELGTTDCFWLKGALQDNDLSRIDFYDSYSDSGPHDMESSTPVPSYCVDAPCWLLRSIVICAVRNYYSSKEAIDSLD